MEDSLFDQRGWDCRHEPPGCIFLNTCCRGPCLDCICIDCRPSLSSNLTSAHVVRLEALAQDQWIRQQLLRLGWRGGQGVRKFVPGNTGLWLPLNRVTNRNRVGTTKLAKPQRVPSKPFEKLRLSEKDDELHHRLRLGGLLYGDCALGYGFSASREV